MFHLLHVPQRGVGGSVGILEAFLKYGSVRSRQWQEAVEHQATCESALMPWRVLLVAIGSQFSGGRGRTCVFVGKASRCSGVPARTQSHHWADRLAFLSFAFAHAQNGDPKRSFSKEWLRLEQDNGCAVNCARLCRCEKLR